MMLKKCLLVLFLSLMFANPIKAEVNNQDKSVVYYFHGNKRCSSCMKIEKYTKNTVEKNFKNKVDLRIVNVDLGENSHFISDYNIYSKAVVLVKMVNGKKVDYKNLDKIWYHISNQDKFESYVKTEIEDFLLK